MKKTAKLIMATSHAGLIAPWHGAPSKVATLAAADFEDQQHLSFDLALAAVQKFSRPARMNFLNVYKHRLVATKSFPKGKEAIQALDDVCAGFCHAFSDANTLYQRSQMVGVGQVWIGKTLMQRLT
ncbi:MAG: hypothetical protein LW710_13400 [Burkholderiales bacterium]|jgi:hypothetical protein|uniref:hypothetical protein n=1 Tax=Limnobacter sp. TaxID=2003368 RepID=UPI0039320972|nr:hypothetical protein [Burkholderiales bacterium]